MIIRRVKTRHFVQLENALVRDRRLALDEHGMLHYLLSLPDDWEVSRANCAKFWGIGREKAGRIFRALRKTGWARVERIHGEDGTFLGTRWIITDEPGEEVSDEVLDSEADEDEAGAPAADVPADHAPATVPTGNHHTAEPEYGSAVVRVNRSAANPYHGHYIDSTKTDSHENRGERTPAGGRTRDLSETPKADPPDVPQDSKFSDLLGLWPPDLVLSRQAAEQAWQRLGKQARASLVAAAPRYLDDCRRNGRKVCGLQTYIRERRDERFAVRGGGTTFAVRPNTAQWHRWREWRIAMGHSVTFFDAQGAKGASFTVPSEWPPPVDPERKAMVNSGDATATNEGQER